MTVAPNKLFGVSLHEEEEEEDRLDFGARSLPSVSDTLNQLESWELTDSVVSCMVLPVSMTPILFVQLCCLGESDRIVYRDASTNKPSSYLCAYKWYTHLSFIPLVCFPPSFLSLPFLSLQQHVTFIPILALDFTIMEYEQLLASDFPSPPPPTQPQPIEEDDGDFLPDNQGLSGQIATQGLTIDEKKERQKEQNRKAADKSRAKRRGEL